MVKCSYEMLILPKGDPKEEKSRYLYAKHTIGDHHLSAGLLR